MIHNAIVIAISLLGPKTEGVSRWKLDQKRSREKIEFLAKKIEFCKDLYR